MLPEALLDPKSLRKDNQKDLHRDAVLGVPFAVRLRRQKHPKRRGVPFAVRLMPLMLAVTSVWVSRRRRQRSAPPPNQE